MLAKTLEEFKEGQILIVNKPLTWSSFDVVNKIRYRIKCKVGHTGTLDPMATGVLVLCTGRFTKKINTLTDLDKVYEGRMKLGETTASFDQETEVEETFPIEHITEELLLEKAKTFIGEQFQIPPKYSAIKKDGIPLYQYARKGIEMPEIRKRWVNIHSFDLSNIALPFVDFRVHCEKGTYIRSLVHDFGQSVDSGAWMSDLHRTAVGHFKIEDAWNLEELVKELENRFE